MGKPGAGAALIAVVDDDQAVCDAISSLVRSAGYRCATFETAEAFLASGRLADAHCLLLNAHLPRISGRALQLRLNRANCDIPIIFLSAVSDRPREQTLRQGAFVFLLKPFGDEELLNAIHRALNGPG